MMRNGTDRVVFVMPRCRHDHIRGVHKQAWSVSRQGHEVVLVVKDSDLNEYMGMQVVVARAPFKSILRPILNLPALFIQIRNLDGDLFVLRNPDTIPLAIVLCLTGRNVIYDTHEDFSKRPLMHRSLPTWLRPATAWLITKLERLLARITSGVIVTQRQQLNILGGQTSLQPNAPLTSGPIIKAMRASNIIRTGNEISLIYVGEITRRRGIFSMLNLIEEMNKHCVVRLNLVGWIRSENLKRQVMQHSGWRFVSFHDAVSHAESLARIRISDIGLAILEPVVDYPTTSVTKLFEYMQCGIPFIASDFAAWKVSTDLGSPGVYVDPDSPEELIAAALQLASNPTMRGRMGNAGRRYVETEFNWERLSKPFLNRISELLVNQKELGVRAQ